MFRWQGGQKSRTRAQGVTIDQYNFGQIRCSAILLWEHARRPIGGPNPGFGCSVLRRLTIAVLVLAPGIARAEPIKLGGSEIRETVTGSLLELDTPLGTTLPIRFTGDGLMSGKAGSLASVLGASKDRGRWWVKGDKLCYKWFRWFDAEAQCLTVHMKDERVYWRQDDGKRGTATIVERAVVVAEQPKRSVRKPAERNHPEKPIPAPAQAAAAGPFATTPDISTAAIVSPVLKSPPRLAVRRKSPAAELGVASADMPDRGLFFVGRGLAQALQSQVRPLDVAGFDGVSRSLPKPVSKPETVQKIAKPSPAFPVQTAAAGPMLPVPKSPPRVLATDVVAPSVTSPPQGPLAFSVYGVPAWDVLNMRSGPSQDHAVVGIIPPNGRDVRLVGPCVELWCQIQFRDRRGWVNRYYLLAQN